MSSDWLREDLWRAHVSWLSPPWVGSTEEDRKDFDAVRWLDQIQSAHYETLIFYVKHHDGWTAYPSRYAAIQPERDYLGECVAEVRRRGMRIMVYYSSVLDQVAGRVHPDWRVQGRDGQPAHGWFDAYWPGAYLCINHPGYREYMLGQLTELRDHYHPDGFWLDVFSSVTGENCFCPHCREKYTAQTGRDLTETQGEVWYDSCFVAPMAAIRAIVKRDDPQCVLGQNNGLRIPGVDELVDFYTHEAVTAPTISLMSRSFRAGGKPFETTYRAYSAVGSWAMRGPDRVLLESMATAAHGGACSIELSPTYQGKLMDQAVARLTEVGAYVRARERYLVDTEPVLDAALLQRATAYGWPREAGWSDVLVQRDLPFALVYPDADLSAYRLVILDDAVGCDEVLAQRLREYVAAGGNLLVEAGAAAFGTPTGEILSEVLGVTPHGEIGAPAQYLSDLDPRIAADMGEDDLVVEGVAWRVGLTTAAPLAYFRYEFAARHPENPPLLNLPPARTRSDDPALTLNAYGQGRALYLACPLGTCEICRHRHKRDDLREYPVQLAANLARLMVGEPLLEGTTPAGVEVIVNRQGGRHVVHLLNQYVAGQYDDNRRGPVRLARVPVSVNEHRLGRVSRALQVTEAGEKELPLERRGQWAEVTIPEVGVHEMLVLEH